MGLRGTEQVRLRLPTLPQREPSPGQLVPCACAAPTPGLRGQTRDLLLVPKATNPLLGPSPRGSRSEDGG